MRSGAGCCGNQAKRKFAPKQHIDLYRLNFSLSMFCVFAAAQDCIRKGVSHDLHISKFPPMEGRNRAEEEWKFKQHLPSKTTTSVSFEGSWSRRAPCSRSSLDLGLWRLLALRVSEEPDFSWKLMDLENIEDVTHFRHFYTSECQPAPQAFARPKNSLVPKLLQAGC